MSLLCRLSSAFFLSAPALAMPIVIIGEISEFSGPDDLNLDPAFTVVAIDCYGDSNRTVNGVLFETDKSPKDNATVTASNFIDDWTARPSYVGANINSVENLEQIMRDIRWELAPAGVGVEVSGLEPGKDYQIQLLFNEGKIAERSWDISVEGELAVDNFRSQGEGTWTINNGFVYTAPFTLEAGDTVLNVEMRGDLGGQPASAADNNPILQAFVVSEIPRLLTPDSVSLDRLGFFQNQTEPVGVFTTVDQKEDTNHLYELVVGFGDNDKFVIDEDRLELNPGYDFSQHAVGSEFSIRVRSVDSVAPERFLAEDFTLTLQSPIAPTEIGFSFETVSKSSAIGTTLGEFTVTDANAVDAHVISLVGGADLNLFTLEDSFLRLAALVPAGRTTISVLVRATDLSGLFVEAELVLEVVESSLRINEIMPSNFSSLVDEDGESSDWIEIYNEPSNDTLLEGWYLTNDLDELTKWRFSGGTVTSDGYLIVYASGKNRPTGVGELHTNFNLSGGGGFLALVKPDGLTIASQLEYPEVYPGVSYGRDAAGVELGFLREASPGQANGDTSANAVNRVTFSQQRGLYESGFELSLSADLTGSVIRYTTDGSEPTPNSGEIYTGPFMVMPETRPTKRGTRRIRAIALNPAVSISPVATHTYLWIDGTTNPDAIGVTGQRDFERSITQDEVYGPLMSESLRDLPVISISKNTGVSSSEEKTSIELLSKDGSEPGFQIDCGIKIVGGDSVNSPKNNLRLFFRGIYGESKLRYPVFANHPYTEGASDEFDVLQLRGGSHDSFFYMAAPALPPILDPSWPGGGAQYIRNRWISDAQMLMGKTSLHGRYVHCYLNGVYHGLFHLHERPMHNYMDKYFGGNPEDYHYTNATKTGSDHSAGWRETWDQVKLAAVAGGEESKRWINWESLADYQLLQYYSGNTWDWRPAQNWMAAGPTRPDEGGWRFFAWDQDVMLYDPAANNLTGEERFNAVDGVFELLMEDEDFRVYFSDRVYRYCFNEGFLTPGPLQESHDYRMNEIKTALVAETARWQPDPNNPRDPGLVGLDLPWDRDQEWMAEWDFVRDTFWPQRNAILIQQLRDRGWYPIDAPEFSPSGGPVDVGTTPVPLTHDGELYITTDGSDPRMPGGTVNPNAILLSGSDTIPAITESSQVNARIKMGEVWSPVNELRFLIGPPADATNLVVSEFSYRPAKASASEGPRGLYSRTDFEFIELTNISFEAIHLDGVHFTDGVGFDFSEITFFGLEPGESFLIVENLEAFQVRYPEVPREMIVGTYSGKLSNDGERIALQAADGSVIRDFIYNDQLPWPIASDGDGYSLELITPGANPDHTIGQNWRSSLGIGGSPAGIINTLSFAEWRAANFSSAELSDLAISGPNGDPDLDGWTNYAEFALGMAPFDRVARVVLPEMGYTEVDGETYLTFTYREWAGAANVVYSAEVSDDLDDWKRGPEFLEEMGTPTIHDDGTTSRIFRVKTSVNDSLVKFVRLHVDEP